MNEKGIVQSSSGKLIQTIPWIVAAEFVITGLFSKTAFGASRFPKPDFESGYTIPSLSMHEINLLFSGYTDVAVLLAALVLATLLVVKWRSRKGLVFLSIFCLFYFGFIRKGCVCSVGALQNIALALVDHSYTLPLSLVIFFLLPLVFALFYGRVFCGSVCPFGAIQDVVLLHPVKIPGWLAGILKQIPVLYLLLTILWVITGTGFIICQYDPFIGFFRFTGPAASLILGGVFLIAGIVIARPYCRFFCPYGVLLGWLSYVSKWRLQISQGECIQCRLCEDACPGGALLTPTTGDFPVQKPGIRRFIISVSLLPVFILLAGLAGSIIAVPISGLNPQISLYRQVSRESYQNNREIKPEIEAFLSSKQTKSDLYRQAIAIRKRFVGGGWILGGIFGLIIGLRIIGLTIIPNRKQFEPDPMQCYHCGRCFNCCPKELTGQGGTDATTGIQ